MTTRQTPTPPATQKFHWAFLIPEQIWLLLVVALVAPGVYGIHYMRHHRVALGVALGAGWAVLFGFLFWGAHRRRSVRLWFTIPLTVIALWLGAMLLN